MSEATRLKSLKIALMVIGFAFIVGLPVFMFALWPSGWSWHTGHSDYPLMIVGVYATLGAFLIVAARNPYDHLSLIRFTAWSSLVHGLIMAGQSFENVGNHGHLMGDVPALLIFGAVLLALTRRPVSALSQRAA